MKTLLTIIKHIRLVDVVVYMVIAAIGMCMLLIVLLPVWAFICLLGTNPHC